MNLQHRNLQQLKALFVTFLMTATGILFSANAKADDIRGLNQAQIEDFEICLNKKGLTYEQVNGWKNQYWEPPTQNGNSSLRLFHNFNGRLEKPEHTLVSNFDNAILASGLFHTSDRHSFKNAILANMTFIGDYSQLDFSGACLVNVRFYRASLLQVFRIKHQSSYQKNISSY